MTTTITRGGTQHTMGTIEVDTDALLRALADAEEDALPRDAPPGYATQAQLARAMSCAGGTVSRWAADWGDTVRSQALRGHSASKHRIAYHIGDVAAWRAAKRGEA